MGYMSELLHTDDHNVTQDKTAEKEDPLWMSI